MSCLHLPIFLSLLSIVGCGRCEHTNHSLGLPSPTTENQPPYLYLHEWKYEGWCSGLPIEKDTTWLQEPS